MRRHGYVRDEVRPSLPSRGSRRALNGQTSIDSERERPDRKTSHRRGRARQRADGGGIEAEPLAPPSQNIPGTTIPDESHPEGARGRSRFDPTPHEYDDLGIHNATVPEPDIERRSGMERVPPEPLPGIARPTGLSPIRSAR
jgi:hypothetical protein